MSSNIIMPLPESAIVLVDSVEEKVGSLFLAENDKKDPDTGVVTHGAKDVVGKRVKFKEAYGERIVLEGQNCMWFPDLKHCIYYFIEDADTRRE